MAQPVNIIDLSDSIESIDGESDRDLGKDPATPQCSKRGMPAVTSVETSQVTASAATGNFVKVESETSKILISPSLRKPATSKFYDYSVKIVSPFKSESVIKKLCTNTRFTSLNQIVQAIKAVLTISPTQLGYIEPGHGLKGKQRLLSSNDDITCMYECFAGIRTKEIVLWCRVERLKLSPSQSTSQSQPKKDIIAMKISKVEELIEQLRHRHGSRYSVEQYNAWAHLLNVEKHKSLEDPPDLPYFRGTKRRREGSELEDTNPEPVSKSVPSATISPEQRVVLRSKCIEQLDKWHSLLEKGVIFISQTHYEEVQAMIMKDIQSNF